MRRSMTLRGTNLYIFVAVMKFVFAYFKKETSRPIGFKVVLVSTAST